MEVRNKQAWGIERWDEDGLDEMDEIDGYLEYGGERGSGRGGLLIDRLISYWLYHTYAFVLSFFLSFFLNQAENIRRSISLYLPTLLTYLLTRTHSISSVHNPLTSHFLISIYLLYSTLLYVYKSATNTHRTSLARSSHESHERHTLPLRAQGFNVVFNYIFEVYVCINRRGTLLVL